MTGHLPLSGPLRGMERIEWMRGLLGSWAHVGLAAGERLIIQPRFGVQRPPP